MTLGRNVAMSKLDLRMERCGLSLPLPPRPPASRSKAVGTMFFKQHYKFLGFIDIHITAVLAKHNMINVDPSRFLQVYFLSCVKLCLLAM